MSVVIRLHHEHHPVMLIPGDLDAVGLADLIARGKHLGCDILLFPHHGGNIGHGGNHVARAKNNADFAKLILEQVNPRLVLFSIGRGRFSTPRPEIINEIQSRGSGCHIHCTQLSEHCQAVALPDKAAHLADLPSLGMEGNQCCGGSLEIIFRGENTVDQIDRNRHIEFVSGSVATPLCKLEKK
jgi:competence protein ComEC